LKDNPLFALGFRPFYTLAAVFAVIAIGLWLVSFTGMVQLGGHLQGVFWHSHEMVFGFVAAIITGFLFTAVRNWTGLPTPTGLSLGAIALVWIAGRVLPATGPYELGIILDVVFLPVVAIAVAIPIFRSGNKRNYKVVALIATMAVLHFVLHLALGGDLPAWLSRSSLFAVMDVIAILFAVVGGRVIPAFTRNAVQGSDPVHKMWLEVSAFGLLLLVAAVTFASGGMTLSGWLLAVPAILAACAHSLRLAYWQPAVTLGNPLLWMMPVAYSWLPVALLLRGLSELAIVPPSTWIHALTAGAFTSLMMAMMMRSTLGHTGRNLAANKTDILVFLMLQLAAISRVLAGIVADHRTMTVIAGVCWIVAFAAFLARYAPMLLSPRSDGKPG
jgi:uncharacterized protein involved in response to NO